MDKKWSKGKDRLRKIVQLFSFLLQNFYNTDVNNNLEMFGKAECKLCGDSVRFALRHLKEKHPETLKERCNRIEYAKDNGKISNNTVAMVVTIYSSRNRSYNYNNLHEGS